MKSRFVGSAFYTAVFGVVFFLSLVILVAPKMAVAATLTVRAGYPQPSGAQIPLWVAAEARTDRRYGFDLQVIYISGGARLTQTVFSGDIDMAMTGELLTAADDRIHHGFSTSSPASRTSSGGMGRCPSCR